MLKKFIYAVIIGAVLILIVPLLIAYYLSPQDELQKADGIVVVSGGDTNLRINEGVKLYQDKWAPKIVFSGAAASGDVSNALAMKRIAIQKGVPSEDVLIEEDSKTTSENAEFSAKLVRAAGMKSIILVTSPYHQRRAYSEFRRSLGKDFLIINHSAKDETWRKKSWWEDSNARFLTFGEVLKNFYAVIFGEK